MCAYVSVYVCVRMKHNSRPNADASNTRRIMPANHCLQQMCVRKGHIPTHDPSSVKITCLLACTPSYPFAQCCPTTYPVQDKELRRLQHDHEVEQAEITQELGGLSYQALVNSQLKEQLQHSKSTIAQLRVSGMTQSHVSTPVDRMLHV